MDQSRKEYADRSKFCHKSLFVNEYQVGATQPSIWQALGFANDTASSMDLCIHIVN
jgi:hypothetical protein